jgi:ribosomal protein S18 acetylase RimI-like enzyme
MFDILVPKCLIIDYGISRRFASIAGADMAVKSAARAGAGTQAAAAGDKIAVRPARATDISQVAALDKRVTGLAKPDYWQQAFERYSAAPAHACSFLVAESREPSSRQPILGFILGEVRAWEFGSAPCGWVLALSVEPRARLHGVGQALFEAMAAEFKAAGVRQMRTMVARDNRLHLMFFRSEGMTAGPYLQLEKELD